MILSLACVSILALNYAISSPYAPAF